MELDRLIHEKKHFAELDDTDVETFLRERKFQSEHLNIEFKSGFPQKLGGKYEIKKICKYVVGFTNEEGGFVIYGVADTVKTPSVNFPDYVPGLRNHPSMEDIGLWIKDRIHPLVSSPALRFFNVASRRVAIFKIPSGVNKPYLYCEPETRSLAFFKKTAGSVIELSPDEVREFYRSQIIEQSRLIMLAGETLVAEPVPQPQTKNIASKHAQEISTKLEDPENYGVIRIYCRPVESVNFSIQDLQRFVETHRLHFSESMRYFRQIEVHQNYISVGYFPTAVRDDVKSTVRISLYRSGFTALDALADTFLDGDKKLHSGWLSYELQRHLQLTKALLSKANVSAIDLELNIEHEKGIRLVLLMDRFSAQHASYSGSHEPIRRRVPLVDIYDYDGDKRNIAIPVVQDIMGEVGTIFGLSRTPPNLWDNHGYLTYVRGVEGQR